MHDQRLAQASHIKTLLFFSFFVPDPACPLPHPPPPPPPPGATVQPPTLQGSTPPAAPDKSADLEVLALLGEGSFGAVYRAESPDIDEPVAVKLLHPAIAHDQNIVDRFQREIQIMELLMGLWRPVRAPPTSTPGSAGRVTRVRGSGRPSWG